MADEQRRYPRLRASLPIRLGTTTMTTENVSLSGAQVSCPSMRFDLVGARLRSGPQPMMLFLGDQGRLEGTAEVVYVSEHGDEYLLGVAFRELGDDALQELRAYLARHGGERYLSPE